MEELKKENDNPIIYYKSQGQTDISSNFKDNDFLLCIQTAFQKDMMQKYSCDTIFIDSTHSTSQYDFLLTTILVADELGEAIPVAWAMANREDVEIIKQFLKALKTANNEKDYHTHIFTSDLANTFYNAWLSTLSTPDQRLYCSWHVDKSWKKKWQSS